MTLVIILILVTLLASFTQGVTGFGSALVAVPLLSFVLPLQVVVPLTILNGVVITCYLSFRMWPHIDRRKIMPLIIGCLPGIVIGAWFLKNLDQGMLRLLLGIILVGYSLYSLADRLPTRRLSSHWGLAAGFGTGLIGAALSAGGPPTIVYTTLTGWSKDDIKATLSGFFTFTGVSIALAHWLTGLTTAEVLRYWLIGLPSVVAGVLLGARVYDRIDSRRYLRVVLICLLVMGIFFLIPTSAGSGGAVPQDTHPGSGAAGSGK